jgi:HSP20 family protein
MRKEAQTVPVRIYESGNHLMLAAPMPGLQPQDISISIADHTISIRGEERGPRQDNLELLMAEWNIGPYFREIALDQAVNGDLTHATYGNGVLVLAMPKARDGRGVDAEFTLEAISAARGERVGHTGSAIHPAGAGEREARKKIGLRCD